MDPKLKSTSSMTRKSFLKATALFPLTTLSLGQVAGAPVGDMATEHPEEPRQLRVGNAYFQLDLTAGRGLKVEFAHVPWSIPLAAGDYSYSFGLPIFAEVSSVQKDDTTIVKLGGGTAAGIEIRQKFWVPKHKPWVEEEITLTNRSLHPLALPQGRCGFVLPVKVVAKSVESKLGDFRFTAVPYRREPTGNRTQYADYTLLQVLTELRSSQLRAEASVRRVGNVVWANVYPAGIVETQYAQYSSEGWILTDGRRGFLITKYSPPGMEWALLDQVPVSKGYLGLRWGGFSIFQGDPERGAWLAPQQSYRFGITRVTAFEGGLNEGFYAFRAEMEARGHGCPTGFNPPVHWNELYDNKLWWLPDGGMQKPENRKKYYTLEDLKQEAAKARDIGCEALYLDPGWDTTFASKIWDEARLGKLQDFVTLLRREYGLSLSLHTPLSGWCDPSSYSRDIDRMNRDGSRVALSLCGASQQYVEETLARLKALAEGGATFFMFDGTAYNGTCWDPHHGHRVPSGREEHVEATNGLARMVHASYPDVLIEMHDQLLGGSPLRYVPTYYGHGRNLTGGEGTRGARGFDSVWAFELMWDPMTDLVGGHSIALYYYNLAYSLPLYIHIDLRKDNRQCLMFWWNASTCRHLGIGGTHPEPAVREAQKAAMVTYRRLETFFKAGRFFGLDEMVHVHVHPRQSAAVINCFNLEDHPVTRRVEFTPSRFGLDSTKVYEAIGAPTSRSGDVYLMNVAIPAYGQTLVEFRPAQ